MKAFDPTDFAELQSQKWHARLRAAATAAGFDNPYFRSHQIRAGAQTVVEGRELINFSSYDYLGLNGDARVNDAAKAAIDAFGTSVSASRIVAGERPFHLELERRLADLYGVEEAVAMVSGHATNVTTVGHLLAQPDLLVCDASVHNSVVVGGRLSRATVLKFPHNDMAALEALLAEHRGKYRRCLIAVEGLYSMEGDVADLPALVEIKKRHAAWLMVDEAHALGLIGQHGLGSAEHHGVDGKDVDIWMGTLSKALASTGGYIAGSSVLIEYLKHSAPGFVFSVGLSAPTSAAASAAIDCLKAEPERVARLAQRSRMLKDGLDALGINTGTSYGSGIIPAHMGDSFRTMIWAERLFQSGVNVSPIVFPAVPYEGALLRFFVSSEHSESQIQRTLALVGQTYQEVLSLPVDFGELRNAFSS